MNLNQLIDYPGAHPGATILYHALDMNLNVHLDAS